MKSDGGGSGWGTTKRRDSNWCGRELSVVESGRIQLPGRREQPSGMRAGPVGVDCGFPNGMFVPSTPLAATSSYLIPTSSRWHPEDDLVCKHEKSASHPWCAGWQVGNTARISQRDDADSSVLIPQLMVCRIILHSL